MHINTYIIIITQAFQLELIMGWHNTTHTAYSVQIGTLSTTIMCKVFVVYSEEGTVYLKHYCKLYK